VWQCDRKPGKELWGQGRAGGDGCHGLRAAGRLACAGGRGAGKQRSEKQGARRLQGLKHEYSKLQGVY